jgi:hypothetical protein
MTEISEILAKSIYDKLDTGLWPFTPELGNVLSNRLHRILYVQVKEKLVWRIDNQLGQDLHKSVLGVRP